MKLEIVGSRKLTHINIDEYIPDGVDEIVSGGAVGVDVLGDPRGNNIFRLFVL